MKRIKRVFSILLASTAAFSMASCSPKEESSTDIETRPTETSTEPAESSQTTTVEPSVDPTTTETPTSTTQGNTRDVELPTNLPDLNEAAVAIHYQRSDGKYATWTLWLWDPAGDDDSVEDDFNYMDDFGVTAYYPLSKFGDVINDTLGIIIKKKGTWDKDGTGADRFIDFSLLEADAKNVYHVYFFGGDANIYSNGDKRMADDITTAKFNNTKDISIACTNAISEYKIYCNTEVIKSATDLNTKTVSYSLASELDFNNSYSVEVKFKESGKALKSNISISALYNTTQFNDMYYYDGSLGALYSKEETTFKVWSPISSEITLRVYNNGTPKSVSQAKGDDTFTEYPMTKADKGVFEETVTGDLEGKYYTYFVKNYAHPDGVEIVDPYAKSAGINGVRGMIVDFSKTNPEGWETIEAIPYNRNELTVWETHVADVTSGASWGGSTANKRKYLGLVEEGTSYTASNNVTISTGFDHIKELGVNAVQLVPIFDQANDETSYTFNWGYNPLNYNVLEGMYSSDPYDGYNRIKEFKTVVQKMNAEGINIIMDVVYNHVNSANGSNFDILMPGYYFRYNDDGSLSNGSGCGNETASENLMYRKFMIDSVKFWASEYKLGGFRFDLMGLHDIDTMNHLVAELKTINPNIVVYGEPWMGGTSPLDANKSAKQSNANKYEYYGQFNDQMRDALIKGGLNASTAKGWVTNSEKVGSAEVTAIMKGLSGITYNSAYVINDPNKTVNYVTCHDNYTLYDRITAACDDIDEATKLKMLVLADAVVFTSCGTTFMLAGDEVLRSKKGNSNSYNSGDAINKITYTPKATNGADVFECFKKLIAFKQEAEFLHSDNPALDVKSLDNGATIYYTASTADNDYIVIHSNGVKSTTAINVDGYSVYLDTLGEQTGELSGTIVPGDYQSLILFKTK